MPRTDWVDGQSHWVLDQFVRDFPSYRMMKADLCLGDSVPNTCLNETAYALVNSLAFPTSLEIVTDLICPDGTDLPLLEGVLIVVSTAPFQTQIQMVTRHGEVDLAVLLHEIGHHVMQAARRNDPNRLSFAERAARFFLHDFATEQLESMEAHEEVAAWFAALVLCGYLRIPPQVVLAKMMLVLLDGHYCGKIAAAFALDATNLTTLTGLQAYLRRQVAQSIFDNMAEIRSDIIAQQTERLIFRISRP